MIDIDSDESAVRQPGPEAVPLFPGLAGFFNIQTLHVQFNVDYESVMSELKQALARRHIGDYYDLTDNLKTVLHEFTHY